MTKVQNEIEVNDVLFAIKVKKIVQTIFVIGIILFVILASFFIYKHIFEIIALGIIFFPLILPIIIFARGY
ncbi:MAG: hypothetical protein MJ151_00145 [Lachnospiraceae bacterium]|nr:hypothetical protein [Lachnospiraceae bacterium]